MKTGKLKRLFSWTVGLVLASIVTVSIALSILDWNQYRDTLASLVSKQLGMRVELVGNVKIGLLPRPSMSAESVRLLPPNADAVTPVATADRIDVQLGVGALLKGKLEVQHLGLNGLAVTLEETGDGGVRLQGWPASAAEDTDSATIQMDRLQIAGGRITLLELAGTKRSIEQIGLQLSGALPTGPLTWQGEFSVSGERVVTSGRLRPGNQDEEALSLKTEIVAGGGTIDLSGRLEDGAFIGRIQLAGKQLDQFIAAAQKLASGEAPGDASKPPVPALPFELDLQVDRTVGVSRITSRTLSVGETRGRIDLTLAARGEQQHVGGTLSLGIIDAEPWLAMAGSNAGQAGTSAESSKAGKMPVFGTIDVTIEGIHVKGDLIQQVDFALGMADDGLFVNGLQALLPGATNLTFSGRVGTNKKGGGTLMVASGNVPDLLRWGGFDPTGQIPAGRLATADLKAQLVLGQDQWSLVDIASRIDTTNLTGRIQGGYQSALPRSVVLSADLINLDAYLPETSGDFDLNLDFLDQLPAGPSSFAFNASKVQWLGRGLSDIELRGEISPAAISFHNVQMSSNGSTARLAGAMRKGPGGWEIETETKLNSWALPIVTGLVPEAQPYVRAAGIAGLNGMIRATGPLGNIHLTADLSEGRSKRLNLSGTVTYKENMPVAFDVQGNIKHDNLTPLAALVGVEIIGPSAADVTISARSDASSKASLVTILDVSGAFAGGQLVAKGQQHDSGGNWQVTYDHREAQKAAAQFLPQATMPAPTSPLRISANAAFGADGWQVNALDIRNGEAQVAGAISADNKHRINGKLSGAGFIINQLGKAGPSSAKDTPMDLRSLQDLAGRIDLALTSVMLAGQKLQAPAAAFTAGDRVLRLDMGQGSQLNGQAASLTVDMIIDEMPRLKGQFTLASVDLAALLLSEGFGSIANGNASLSFDFEGRGATSEALMKSLRGRGQIKASAGALNFLGVASLVREINQASTTSGFLSSVGTFLRRGSTEFATLDTRFTLDAGVALIEAFTASGPWGALVLDGQINLADNLMDLKGELRLTSPEDAPVIPVRYQGALDNPSANWTSRALESFVIAGIERRLRSTLFKEQETREAASGEAAANPAGAVFGRAYDILTKLRLAQEEQKRKDEAARKAAEAQKKPK